MFSIGMIKEIQRLSIEEGLSQRRIAKLLGISRGTEIEPRSPVVLPGELTYRTPPPALDEDWPDFDPDASEDDRPWDVFHHDDADDDPFRW